MAEIIRDMSLLHPVARADFELLAQNLDRAFITGRIPYKFGVFETYRSPVRQMEVYNGGNSRALPYSSAHQYGLAVDFVPRKPSNVGHTQHTWFWPSQTSDEGKLLWDTLRKEASDLKLINEISWDRAHVEHRTWQDLRWILAKRPATGAPVSR